jgi:hypothetical protein
MFESVVVVVFQNTFYFKMHQNDISFYFLKLFLRSTHQNQNDSKHKKNYFLIKNKINFFKNTDLPCSRHFKNKKCPIYTPAYNTLI